MPATLTYPGVYIQEASSGVHAITGVATSIGAFLGQASMGPINSPVECFSYSDFIRNFGPPVPGSDLAQGVLYFFSNGGSDCFVVRLADGALPAQIVLLDIAGNQVLNLQASSPGLWGSALSVSIDYNTPSPDVTFNLQVNSSNTGSPVTSESFSNLSMDPASPRYAPTFIQQSSTLLNASPGTATATSISKGYSEARGLPAVAANAWFAAITNALPAVGSGGFLISVDGGPWTSVNMNRADLATQAASHNDADTFTYITNAIKAALPVASPASVTVGLSAGGFLQLVSNNTLATGSVQVRMAPSGDIAQALMLGVNQGGIEVARYADLRPMPTGIFYSGAKADLGQIQPSLDPLAGSPAISITKVAINGATAVPVTLTGGPKIYQGTGGATDFDGLRENLQVIAAAINGNFSGFQATVVGYRLFVQNLNPASSQTADTLTIQTTADAAATAFSKLFISNVAAYQLGISTAGTYWAPGVPPSDGGPPTLADYQGDESLRTGVYALDAVDLFNIMVIPGDGISTETEWGSIRAAAAAYCQSRRAFLVLDAPLAWTKNGLPTADAAAVQKFRSPIGDPDINCAVYYPRVQINDNGVLRYVGPSGMVAGMFANTDSSRGVWKAPAGINAALNGVLDLETILSDKQNGVLNPLAVNCLRRMPAGFVIWGARTLAGFDNSGEDDWKYVPVRRMTLFLEESLYRGTQWVVFEPNDEPLWAQIRMNITAFMMGLFRQGAFEGATPTRAFFVKCDSETTTQSDIDNGVVNIVVGFAPLKPAEFVVITIQQIAGNPS
jgi:phage tail sheath protein FI